MDKTSICKLVPKVLKRMEYGIDRFYLLNFNNNEFWIGNYASYHIIKQIDGTRTLEQIISNVQEKFDGYTTEQIYESSIDIIKELVEKKFLEIVR